ncbi:MAG: hypothetical protein IPN94_22490 [Sphingobacteriales bacterium]|nr:hypothetical protein [Sphingobacteriales bacterium]
MPEFSGALVKAVQEQQAIIETQNKAIVTQGKTIEVLQAKANEVETPKG